MTLVEAMQEKNYVLFCEFLYRKISIRKKKGLTEKQLYLVKKTAQAEAK
jgi:hypothetical protein